MPEERALAVFEETIEQAAIQGQPPAAVIIEPIQSTEGVHVLPLSFLQKVAEITRRANAVLVFDEIYTGFGRCGTMFYFEQVGVIPDLLVIGKALANGLPIGAVCGPAHIVNSLGRGIQTSTFSGNPLASSVGLHVIEHLISEEVPTRAAEMGRILARELEKLHRETEVYGPPRGTGLMLGFDCIGENGHPSRWRATQFAKISLQERLIANVGGIDGASVRLTPPLILTSDDVATLTNKLAKIASVLRELG
jgi:4-aminobutyrate aminotransferase-like enzyme